MSLLPDDGRMKPIIVVPPETLSADDIAELRKNGLCVVVATDPSKVKFIDPIPAMAGRTKVEDAAIQLSRRLLSPAQYSQAGYLERSSVGRLFADLVIKGTALDPDPSRDERLLVAFDEAKADEVRKIAREEARAEAAARKAAKAAKAK